MSSRATPEPPRVSRSGSSRSERTGRAAGGLPPWRLGGGGDVRRAPWPGRDGPRPDGGSLGVRGELRLGLWHDQKVVGERLDQRERLLEQVVVLDLDQRDLWVVMDVSPRAGERDEGVAAAVDDRRGARDDRPLRVTAAVLDEAPVQLHGGLHRQQLRCLQVLQLLPE